VSRDHRVRRAKCHTNDLVGEEKGKRKEANGVFNGAMVAISEGDVQPLVNRVHAGAKQRHWEGVQDQRHNGK